MLLIKNIFVLILVSSVGLAGCSKGPDRLGALKGELRIAGGTAHLGVMKDVANKLMEDNHDLKISIAGGGSGVGIKQVGEGIIDIGNSGRDLKETEISKYGLIPHPMAIDGIAVIVHPSSIIKNLTTEQARKIFTGKIKNWKDIGGENSQINVYTRDEESGTRKTFVKLLLGKGIKLVKSAHFVNSNGGMKTSVGNDKSSIGYVSVGYLDNSVKAVSSDGIEPNIDNVKSKKYKVQRFLYMVTKGAPQGITKTFIENVLNQHGQDIVKKHHFIPIK